MAICSRCGNYSPDGTVMCPVCGTPFPPMPQMSPQAPTMSAGIEIVPPPVANVQPIQQQPVSSPSMPSVGSVGSAASQVVTQTVQQAASNAGLGSIPSIPNIPSADAIGTMATGGLKQAATQAARQFTGGIDLMATETQGEMVLSSWKMPTSVPSAMQMGASAVQKATKGKYAWMWFLIPVFTILAWVISQLAK